MNEHQETAVTGEGNAPRDWQQISQAITEQRLDETPTSTAEQYDAPRWFVEAWIADAKLYKSQRDELLAALKSLFRNPLKAEEVTMNKAMALVDRIERGKQ